MHRRNLRNRVNTLRPFFPSLTQKWCVLNEKYRRRRCRERVRGGLSTRLLQSIYIGELNQFAKGFPTEPRRLAFYCFVQTFTNHSEAKLTVLCRFSGFTELACIGGKLHKAIINVTTCNLHFLNGVCLHRTAHNWRFTERNYYSWNSLLSHEKQSSDEIRPLARI